MDMICHDYIAVGRAALYAVRRGLRASPGCIFMIDPVLAGFIANLLMRESFFMHILYIDDSGSVENSTERYFVLAGVAVFERAIFHQIKSVDECVRNFQLGDPHDIELHGSPMYAGRGDPWRGVRDRSSREKMIQNALDSLKGQSGLRLFAIIIDKHQASPQDPIALAFEEICNRFNLFLTRMNDRRGENQKGLLVMDESKHEKPLQMLAKAFRIDGARWGHFRNLAEVPFFVDSQASRLVQLADLIAWATFRKYEHGDGRFFDSLLPLFDADGGVIHGLFHHRRPSEPCYCPACMSRWQRDARVPRLS
jgi:hypothetical protein